MSELNNVLDGKAVKAMIISAANSIKAGAEKINDMNVFPVPDGDTGTNMCLTFTAAAKSAVELSDNEKPAKILETLAKAALRGARGNSGVILSQILRGLHGGVKNADKIGVSEIKDAAVSARDVAYRAVMKPTEGTILTVVREMAEFAESSYTEYDSAHKFITAILDAGDKSLKSTPEILPVLKQAGVVDAGGMGLMTLLRGAAEGLSGDAPAELDFAESAGGLGAVAASGAELETSDIKYRYCTEFLINKDGQRGIAQFTAAIRPKGDCMLVIDDDEIVKVHIHTNHPGFVLEQAIKLGELTNLKIDNMKYQHNEKIREQVEAAADEGEILSFGGGNANIYDKKYAAVAVVSGSGMEELFKSLDCDKIISGGQTMNPSTEDILSAAKETGAENVYVLPNNKNIILAAQQAAELADANVIVIPTKNMPQGISALSALDRDAEIDENTCVMTEMAESVKCGQITYAARDTRMNGLDIHKGDVMAVEGSEVLFVGMDTEEVALRLAERLISKDTGVVSVYCGEDADESEAESIAEKLEKKYKDIDVSVNVGGQAVYSYIIAAE